MSDLINEAVIKRRLEIFLEFIDYFDNDYRLGLSDLLNNSDLSFVRVMWEQDHYEAEDATEFEYNL